MAETAKILYKKGSKGDEVTNIQTALGDYYTSLGGTPDADYGNKTHDAVFKWQEDWNNDPAHETDQIKVDGIVGEQTYPRLMQWHANKQLPTFTESELLGEKPAAAPAPAQGNAVTGNLQGETVAEFTAGKAAANGTPEAPAIVSGNLQGETVSEFAAGKAAANGTPGGTPEGTPIAKTPEAETPATDPTAATPDAKTPAPGTPQTEQPDKTTQDSGQAQVVTTPSKHLYDYANNSLGSIMNTKDNNVPVRELLDDYFKWCQENGKMIDYFTVNDIVNKTPDLSKSPIENEKARKKAERKEKFDQLGNFLLHLGNAIGNVGGGGYASMKIEDPIQFTERQRQLKEKADQIRKANNQSIFQQMQKGWAEQRAAEIQKNALARQQKQDELAQKRLDNESKKLDAYIQATKQKTADNTRLTDSKIDLNDKTGKARMITANKPRAGRSNPYKETITERTVKDANGNVQKEIATRSSTRPYSGRNQGRGQGRGLKKLPTAKK